VRDLLRELKEEGRTILLSTHMMGEAERLADEIILIHQGKVVLDGTLTAIRSSFGKNTLHIDYEGDGSFLQTLPEVKRAVVVNHSAELTLSEGADPQRILEAAVAGADLHREGGSGHVGYGALKLFVIKWYEETRGLGTQQLHIRPNVPHGTPRLFGFWKQLT
jgi:ABC-type multidrug transport system ATPase subunit